MSVQQSGVSWRCLFDVDRWRSWGRLSLPKPSPPAACVPVTYDVSFVRCSDSIMLMW